MAGQGRAGHGEARLGRLGRAGLGRAGQGKARQGKAGGAGPGVARLGKAGSARLIPQHQREIMNITLNLVGTSPLLCHNPRMVDPEYQLNREIKAITGKRKKTDDDLRDIERLEWYGGLYEENGVVVQPVAKVRKCLINTAKIMKLGKGIERTLVLNGLTAPLIHDGPKDIDALFKQPRFHSRLSVGVNGKRVMRVRPSFYPWAMTVNGVFVTDAGVNLDELQRIVELAGTVEGIGDNRVNGYGRFVGTLEVGK